MAPLLGAEERSGEVLGASAAAIYLRFTGVTGAPDVLAIIPRSSVRLPVALVAAGEFPPVTARARVVAGGGVVGIGEHVWAPVRWFDPRPRTAVTPLAERVAAASTLLRALPPGAVGLAQSAAWEAARDLAGGDARAALHLLGAGPGLTPAGDDVVAGAIAVLVLAGQRPDVPAPIDMAEVIVAAGRKTTALSTALLHCAAEGQVIPQAAAFLAALSGRGSLSSSLAGLRQVGSTSGTALALGIVAASGVVRPPRSPA